MKCLWLGSEVVQFQAIHIYSGVFVSWQCTKKNRYTILLAAEEGNCSCWNYIDLKSVEIQMLAKKEYAIIQVRLFKNLIDLLHGLICSPG